MSDATYIACPRCGEPYAMTPMQKRLYHGRTVACQRCAKPFTVTEQTPDPVPAPSVRPWAEMTPPPPESISPSASAAESAGSSPSSDADPAQGFKPPRKPGAGMTPGRMALLILGACTLVLLVLYVALLPSINRARETGRRAACAGNL